MSEVIVRINRKGARYQVIGCETVGLWVDALPIVQERQTSYRQNHQGANIVFVDPQSLFANARGLRHFFRYWATVKIGGLALQGEFLGVRIFRVRPRDAARFRRGQFDLYGPSEVSDDLVLHRKEIGLIRVELIGPKVSARQRVNELGVDSHARPALLCATLQHVAHAELLADLLYVHRLAAIGEGRGARDDETARQPRQAGGQFFSQNIAEIILARIAREI